MSRPVENDATVTESYSIPVPASVREEAGIEAGDRLRWSIDDDGNLGVEVIRRRRGAFASLEPVDLDRETDVAADHDRIDGDY